MATRWWLYDEELYWASRFGDVKMYLLHASDDRIMRFLVRGLIARPNQQFTIETRDDGCKIYDGPCLIVNSMDDWDLQKAIKWAMARTKLNEVELEILRTATDDYLHNGFCDLKGMLPKIKEKYPRVGIAGAKRRAHGMAPKYLRIDGNHVYVTAVGFWCSGHKREVREVIEETLQAYIRLSNRGSLPRTLAFNALDLRCSSLSHSEAFRIVQTFQLGEAAANGQWQSPADISNLTSARVRSVEQLWLYNRTHRHVERPWPTAVERHPSLEVVEFLSDDIPTGPRHEDGTPDRVRSQPNLRIVR